MTNDVAHPMKYLSKFLPTPSSLFVLLFSFDYYFVKNIYSGITACNVQYMSVRFIWSMPLLLLSHFSHVWLCATPETAAYQAPLSLGFSRQEHWSGLPFPSPVHESEKWKWSPLVVSNSSQPHVLQPTRLLRPWDFPGKSIGVGCHCLLHLVSSVVQICWFPICFKIISMCDCVIWIL